MMTGYNRHRRLAAWNKRRPGRLRRGSPGTWLMKDRDRKTGTNRDGRERGNRGPPPGPGDPASACPSQRLAYDVLVVDDVREVRRAVESYLRAQGASVLVAATGEQAVELARACRFRAVLTDYQLPGLGGAALVEDLRAALPDARIVVMSGSGLTDEEVKLLSAAGMDAFLSKPFGLDQLRELTLVPSRPASSEP